MRAMIIKMRFWRWHESIVEYKTMKKVVSCTHILDAIVRPS